MRIQTCVAGLLFAMAAANYAQSADVLTPDAKGAWATISNNVVKSAEKMPAENYTFRPTEGVRSFSELIGHVADANYLFCSAVHSEKKSPPGAEKKLRSKADLVKVLKESVAYCNTAFEQVTDSQASELVPLFGHGTAKLSILYMNVAHANEHYGNIVTYLRLKGIVPPSSEPRAPASAAAMKLYFDRAHGEAAIPSEMAGIAKKLTFEIVSFEEPIASGTVKGSHILYLRAPSKAFSETEKAAVVNFVKQGGSLLLVLDEEHRQKLAITGVNDLISPFGMHLTMDTAYVPNAGALAVAGEINRANREVPYDGGRAVEGGTPFAFQLDKEGKPSQPYGAWQKVDGGGRIVVLGEGMASLFLGSPSGQRLTRVVDDASMSLYWGKDSAIFMEELCRGFQREIHRVDALAKK